MVNWYKDFGSFIICGTGEYLKTVSLAARTGSIVAGGKGPAVRLCDDLGQSAQKRIA